MVVCDGDRFAGLVPMEGLLAAPEAATLGELVDPGAAVVAPGTSREVAAQLAVRRGRGLLAVVDGAGRFLGVVPAARLLAILADEHEEDLRRLAGVAGEASAARHAGVEPVARRLRHRLPWLLVGLAGALASADLLASFEGQLRRHVMLAFFLPGVVYLADAVGTQTETLVVRGLSLGVGLRKVAWRELATGALLGGLVALAFLPVGWWRWGGGGVVLAVALALFAACATATLVAMALPWLLHRLGSDPAYGSGPLATVVQDLLSLLIYMAIALKVTG